MLLARYKRNWFLHRIVTGDKKWLYFENPMLKPDETWWFINIERYWQQIIDMNLALREKWPDYQNRQAKCLCFMIMHHYKKPLSDTHRLSERWENRWAILLIKICFIILTQWTCFSPSKNSDFIFTYLVDTISRQRR